MKNVLLPFSLLCALTVPVAAHADTLYTVTNGQLVSPYLGSNVVGSYSGSFMLSSNFTITSGTFMTTVNGITYAPLTFQMPPYNGSGYAVFQDTAGDHLNFQLINTSGNNSIMLCDVARCGSGDTLFDTAAPNNGMYNFSANGGTLNGTVTPPPPVTTTPEPSSLVLLGTGALGVAGALRRRLRRA